MRLNAVSYCHGIDESRRDDVPLKVPIRDTETVTLSREVSASLN